MATPYKIHLDVTHKPVFSIPNGLNEDSAKRASELLQRNHEDHHIFFNKEGFHNHIAHHILTIYALGASPAQLQRHYDNNASYQRPPVTIHRDEVKNMGDAEVWKRHLGDEAYYHDYLVFFQREMEAHGWQNVVNKYVFAQTEQANDLLVRMFAGFLHPIIHLGFGIEFQQPAIVAEALAQAAIHGNWIGRALEPAEETAKSQGKTLVQLLREIHADTELKNAPRWSDGNKIRDGILARAPDKMLSYISQYSVPSSSTPADLAKKTAEMINASILFTGSAQHPPKEVKFDFYFIHCVNSSIFFSAFLRQENDWLSEAAKRKLLEYKVREDLVMYASRKSPDMLLDEIKGYKPRDGGNDVIKRVLEIDDDGHAAKLVRALLHGKDLGKQYEGAEVGEVHGDMWDKLLHMAIDSVEAPGERWVRSAGFDEAWEKYRDRPVANL